MSLVWTIPVLATVAGALLVLVQLRSISGAASELVTTLRRVEEVRIAVDEARSQAASCRDRIQELRER